MEPGKWIRALREERQIKPSDIQRMTRAVADLKGNSDFSVPHSTLADIEAGSIPSIHKLFSLALSLKVALDELLLPYGIDPKEATPANEPELAPEVLTLQALPVREPFRFRLNFDMNISSHETTLLKLQSQALVAPSLPFWRPGFPTLFNLRSGAACTAPFSKQIELPWRFHKMRKARGVQVEHR